MTVTLALVVAQMNDYGLSPADRAALAPLLALSIPLPERLTIAAVQSVLQQQHIVVSDTLLRQFRDHALYLQLAQT